jgi:hypothetical protein
MLEPGMPPAEKELVFPYLVRRSAAAMATRLGGSEFFRFDAIVEYFPWRGLAVTLALLATWAATILVLGWHQPESAWVAALALGCAACASESLHRRDRLLPEGIERRSGILGGRVRLVPYGSIEYVTVQEPGRGSRVDVGTIVIRAIGDAHRLVAVCAPYEVADFIQKAREAARASRQTAG